MKKIMIQKITQNNWNFWTVNLIMRAKKIVNQFSDFPVRRTGLYRHKKALQKSVRLTYSKEGIDSGGDCRWGSVREEIPWFSSGE